MYTIPFHVIWSCYHLHFENIVCFIMAIPFDFTNHLVDIHVMLHAYIHDKQV